MLASRLLTSRQVAIGKAAAAASALPTRLHRLRARSPTPTPTSVSPSAPAFLAISNLKPPSIRRTEMAATSSWSPAATVVAVKDRTVRFERE